jgi:hypothetical protein
MDQTSNPWVVTAADVAAGPVTVWPLTGKVHIYQIEFEQYTNASDTATVNQANGKSFAFLHGAGDLQTVRTGNVGWADGIVVPQAGITATGTVRIYHK